MSADDNKLYKILGVDPKATHDQIKKAYRKLAAEYHPDKGNDATGEKFAEVSKAYKTLINPEARETYDAESFIDQLAKQNIRQAMTEFVNKSIEGDPLQPVLFSTLVDHFKQALEQDRATLKQVEKKQQRLEKMHGKIKLKQCDDVYAEVLKKVGANLLHDVDVLTKNIELLERVNEILIDYEADEPKPGELIPVSEAQLRAQTGTGNGFFNW